MMRLIVFLLCSLQLGLAAKEMRDIEKRELHLHIGGSWPIEFVQKHASAEQLADLTAFFARIEEGVDYDAIFSVFDIIGKIICTDALVEEGVAALCESLAQDGIVTAELRTGLKDLGSGVEGYLNAVLRGMDKSPIDVRLLLSLRRNTPIDLARTTIDLALAHKGRVVGIDLSGNSTVEYGENIIPELIRARKGGLPVTIHLGESPKESATQQLYELREIQPQRVGHAVHLSPEAYHYIVDNQIPVEFCLTSAVRAGMIHNELDHPAFDLLASGHPVIICTDDPLVFGVTLSEECEKVAKIAGLSIEDIERLQEDAFTYLF